MSATRVYLDSCIVIYFLEGDLKTRTQIAARHPDSSKVKFCTSGLVRLECLVGAYRRSDAALAESYIEFLSRTEIVGASEGIWDRAARIRAETKMKLPDALHLALAEEAGCELFWTVDQHFESAKRQSIKIDLTEFN